MELTDKGRQHMGGFEVVVVVWSIEIGGHHGDEITTILTVIAFAHLNACYLGDGIRLVGGLQDSGKEAVFLYGLWCKFGIDTGTAKEKKFLYSVFPCGMNDVILYRKILVNKLCPIDAVSHDASHLSGGIHYIFRSFFFKKGFHVSLTGKVEFIYGTKDKVGVAFGFKVP